MDGNLAQKVSEQIIRYEKYFRVISDEKNKIERKITALKIYKGRLEGKDFRKIGKEIGVSKQRAHQILESYFQEMLDKR